MIYYTEEEGQALREAFEDEVLTWPQVTQRRMFGCPAYVADGKLFAFLVNGGVVITQVRKRDRTTLTETFTTQPFKAGEREIERWLQVNLDALERLDRVLRYVKKSYEAVLTY